jgi:uncharacterized protein YbjT (DUF2867 family)
MTADGFDVVTGAFGYTGRHIAARLLARGRRVLTLTGHPRRTDPFGGRVTTRPLRFDRPATLRDALVGVDTLYNTYWVRFERRVTTFARAVDNTRTLFRCAAEAGVRRIVHISITNPSLDSPLPYFRGKALLERALADTGLSHATVRPTVLFGGADVLLNNIAWLLRRIPMFAVPGSGEYRIQPVHVEDLAEIAAAAGARTENETLDAVGPDVFTFDELVRAIARAIGSRARIVHVAPACAWAAAHVAGWLLRDVVLTRDELAGLRAGLLVSSSAPTGHTRLSTWLTEHADEIGRSYASELARHYRTAGTVGLA